jgi:hypothetical protein
MQGTARRGRRRLSDEMQADGGTGKTGFDLRDLKDAKALLDELW